MGPARRSPLLRRDQPPTPEFTAKIETLERLRLAVASRPPRGLNASASALTAVELDAVRSRAHGKPRCTAISQLGTLVPHFEKSTVLTPSDVMRAQPAIDFLAHASVSGYDGPP